MDCEYFEELKKYNYGQVLLETKYWLVLLAPDQRNLGTCVVALKRDEEELSGLNTDEWSELLKLVKKLETAIKKAFNTTMFNWGCLMNSSYLLDPPNPHVHWHLIPRYRKPVKFAGYLFKDPCFGKSTMYARGDLMDIPDSVKLEISKQIQAYLNV